MSLAASHATEPWILPSGSPRSPKHSPLRNALLAQRGAEICEEAAKLSAERGSLEEVQKQKEEEVGSASFWTDGRMW